MENKKKHGTMKYFSSTPLISASKLESITEAKKVVQGGGIIVYPTDTLYGFGVDATNETAITHLNQIKKRSGPISIIVSNIEMALSISFLSQIQKEILSKELKGSTTIIVPAKPGFVDPLVSGKDNTIGIRIPDHSFGTSLVRALGKPITTTSVNISGNPPLNEPKSITETFGHFIDLFIEDGIPYSSKGSKILKLDGESLQIIRE